MSDTKNHNVMSEYGVKDLDFVSEFEMPDDLVGTPAVNDWMINKVYEDNLRAETTINLNNGMDSKEAIKLATRMANEGRQEAKKNLANVRKSRGY